ncbi:MULTISPECIES: NUDIX hydrolase [unclassified Streptomyces]|uniref:NUDIX hydrolase n=1 Tax=unclassified Streptomyces TaxID=2593676 RepID=UPI00036475D5|nr:NUDIX domain-containing protein [Streptomyces sp. LaPpAH-202]MYW60879.1 NUDIX domain-containing protein [Streptomyces sp. SID8370]MYW85053.1 NUDIX domain-containing protein [Streptomyces sp. SID8371]
MNYVAELRRLVGTRPLILPGTSVLILDEEGRVLLVERTDIPGWGLPGGLMEPGESYETTGRREVREELGLELDEVSLLDVFSGPEYYFRYDHGDEVFNVTAAFTAVARGELRLREDELRSAAYFPVDALPDHIIDPELPILRHYAEKCRRAAADPAADPR